MNLLVNTGVEERRAIILNGNLSILWVFSLVSSGFCKPIGQYFIAFLQTERGITFTSHNVSFRPQSQQKMFLFPVPFVCCPYISIALVTGGFMSHFRRRCSWSLCWVVRTPS